VTSGRQTVGDQRSRLGRGWVAAGQGRPSPFFLNFFIFLMLPPTLWSIFYWKFGEWAKAFGRMGAQYTHFFKLPPSLGSVKSSIHHRVWGFYFILNFIFPKFRLDMGLHIYRLDFRFMEN
jgi:hypothetical protein